MPQLYDRYMQGNHQETYQHLLMMHEGVFERSIYDDALSVAKAMMRRVRANLEMLLPRLIPVHYHIGRGFWDQFSDLPGDEFEKLQQKLPIFRPPTPEVSRQLTELEHLVGPLPLSLTCWYQEVGSVNLPGLFSFPNEAPMSRADGCVLDPLFIYPLDVVVDMVRQQKASGTWLEDPSLSLSPDCYYKYGFSGTGAYTVKLPCEAFDVQITLEDEQMLFIDYLRCCFRYGGFPGLAKGKKVPDDILNILTKDLLPF